jgi:signal transduction histidine kinase
LLLEVSDDGPGITAENRLRIFEPFFTTKPSGTGLGLALVKRVVETHGGVVTLHSGATGATFALALPLDAHAHRAPARETQTRLPMPVQIAV